MLRGYIVIREYNQGLLDGEALLLMLVARTRVPALSDLILTDLVRD